MAVICPGGRLEVVSGARGREWRVLALGSIRGFALESGGRLEVVARLVLGSGGRLEVAAGPCARWRVLAVGINQRDAEEFSG